MKSKAGPRRSVFHCVVGEASEKPSTANAAEVMSVNPVAAAVMVFPDPEAPLTVMELKVASPFTVPTL
jgi:hypothetical protein